MTRMSTVESYQERMTRVLVHIQGRLDEPLPLEELAGVACFSPYHFHRIFRGMVGESVKEHVRRLRLERAAQRLKQSSQPVTEIAFDAGYAPSGGGPPLDVRIERFDGMRVAFIRHVGSYDSVGAAWGRLMGWAWPKGLFGPHARMVGIVHDDTEITPPEKLRYDAAITVGPGIGPEGEVGIQQLEPGEYGVALHKGPYDGLGETYARMCGEWLPASGRELRSAPALEFYLNSPQTTPPAELLTRICLPLE